MQASTEQKRISGRAGDSKRSLETAERAYKFASLSSYSFKQRLLIRAADLVFYVLIGLFGRTTRFEVEGAEHWDAASTAPHIPILSFWHNQVFLATWRFRKRGIIVMTSQSFDGEYIARFIQRFGYGAARGSSTRGGVGALVEMIRSMRAGRQAGFTIDGPKGPKYVAKMGATLLAKKTGHPVLAFSVTPAHYWEVKSWDSFQVPRPFTRALVQFAPPIYVAADADEEELNRKRDELQNSLDQLTRRGEQWRASSR